MKIKKDIVIPKIKCAGCYNDILYSDNESLCKECRNQLIQSNTSWEQNK